MSSKTMRFLGPGWRRTGFDWTPDDEEHKAPIVLVDDLKSDGVLAMFRPRESVRVSLCSDFVRICWHCTIWSGVLLVSVFLDSDSA